MLIVIGHWLRNGRGGVIQAPQEAGTGLPPTGTSLSLNHGSHAHRRRMHVPLTVFSNLFLTILYAWEYTVFNIKHMTSELASINFL